MHLNHIYPVNTNSALISAVEVFLGQQAKFLLAVMLSVIGYRGAGTTQGPHRHI
jgi:hypothetical protein